MNGPRPLPRQSPAAAILSIAAIAVRVCLWAVVFYLLGYVVMSSRAPEPEPERPVTMPASAYVAQFLVKHGASAARATTVAHQIVAQAKRQRTDVALVTAVMTVENPELRHGAASDSGALGLMQVMPHWTQDPGARRTCRSADLLSDHVNICYGVYVLKVNIAARKTLIGALLAYNGCRSVDSRCGKYPHVVLRRQQALALAMTGEKGTE